MAKISIEAKQGVYLTYKNYTYTSAQVFGEYIDNAIQSNEDHKSQLRAINSDHNLRVDIHIEWYLDTKDKTVKAKNITIEDNAAGMNADTFAHAFNLADNTIFKQGMNEFGVGMKAASAWLGNVWRIESTSVDDKVTRILEVNLKDVADNQIKELDSVEIFDEHRGHGTKISITDLWPENIIKKDSEEDLIKNIASIYRYFIRNNEIRIFFEDQLLTFEDYEALKAPSYKDPEGEDIEWKCPVSIDDHNGHTLSGFVGLLKDMSETNRGVVFTRKNRVVLGFDPKDRTVGKVFFGQQGSRKFRRVYGELEISGLSVAFGKNKLNEPDLLEALCKGAAGKLIIKGTNLLTQADKYKVRNFRKTTSAKSSTPQSEPQSPQVVPQDQHEIVVKPQQKEDSQQKISHTIGSINSPEYVINTPQENYEKSEHLSAGSFYFKDELYSIIVKDSNESDEIFWNNISNIDKKELICNINTRHPFFNVFGKPNTAILAMIKALSIAKFKTNKVGGGNAAEMISEFNTIISKLKP